MVVQIYSMTSIADSTMTAEAGADLVGVVVAEPGVVAEAIETAAARDILAAVRPRARGVALSLADDRDEICAMVDAVRPDIVHIAAREIEPEDCAWIRKRIAPVRLLRAIAVRAGETMAEAELHQETADYLMLDSGAKGARGETHDWSVARAVAERSRIPVILAGGLSSDNVAQAIAAVRPWGVDSFTHTDLPENRGKKDPARVRAFIAAALRGFAYAIAGYASPKPSSLRRERASSASAVCTIRRAATAPVLPSIRDESSSKMKVSIPLPLSKSCAICTCVASMLMNTSVSSS